MYPQLSNIEDKIYGSIVNKVGLGATGRNCFIKVYSGANSGLILRSNEDWQIFRAAGQTGPSIYGDSVSSGDIGLDFEYRSVRANQSTDRTLMPKPIVSSLSIKEGHDQISRECTLGIKCFSLGQLEKIQEYFMEPGYSLCIEYGWNTTDIAAGLVPITGTQAIVSQITRNNLDLDKLHNVRLTTSGSYDSFFGFIVGGNVKSDGDVFNLQIDLKGAPALPTFLQAQNLPIELNKDKNGKVISVAAKNQETPYGIEETYDTSKNTDTDFVARRRFKAMFNLLPTFRQVSTVKNLETSPLVHISSFINFDNVVTKAITDYAQPSLWDQLTSLGSAGKVKAGDVAIEKSKLFSKNKYIKFDLAVAILNSNGVLESYKMGDQQVQIGIDISDSVIGAFPLIFSTKADKLVIPGNIPDFSQYFLNTEKVDQDSLLNNSNVLNASIWDDVNKTLISFCEPADTPAGFPFSEKANYWGYLKNLYVNFDMFKSKLEQKNKNIREIFFDILNEMSSAVNSYWKFQLVEKMVDTNELDPTDKTKQKKLKKVLITVIDENWVGKNPSDKPPHLFYHNGASSVFLESNFDFSIPGEMTGAIVSRRLGYAVNPDTQIVDTGTLFNSKNDLFMQPVVAVSGTSGTSGIFGTNGSSGVSNVDTLNKAIADTGISEAIVGGQTEYFSKKHPSSNGQPGYVSSNDPDVIKYTSLKQELNKITTDNAKKGSQTLNANLEKIDVVPNPKYSGIANSDIDGAVGDAKANQAIKSNFNEKFRIYCFNDTAFLDRIKHTKFIGWKAQSGGGQRLSHPLPIKYTFKILGVSGLRRGDTFNVVGIPRKYSANGLFQITEVEQTVENMMWTTYVTGEYRQFQ